MNDLSLMYKRILSLIGTGKENARQVSYIASVLNLSNRQVREAVSDMVVKHKISIGTSNSHGSCGYYFISTDDEKEETINNLKSRAFKILKRMNAISKAPLKGQEKIEL
ncbi:delta-aminolevulinic acid dehydratase/porphobilinogen synthase [Cytobacillus horneckiae]|uniref:hypothetical protein n=1 Tax=Cytobacillus horneckiae TaxID=549687 RepID=UPI0019D1BB58|nr:hypothetical protein [Cytobacillus horneckiae]MBN6890040.1 hypothetical protein [Cytobacillus horneckiae]